MVLSSSCSRTSFADDASTHYSVVVAVVVWCSDKVSCFDTEADEEQCCSVRP